VWQRALAKIFSLTSPAFGTATSISVISKGYFGFHATAALQTITYPLVLVSSE